MREREIEHDAKKQAVVRMRLAFGAIPSRMTYARKMLGEAIRLLEGELHPDDTTRYHEAKKS